MKNSNRAVLAVNALVKALVGAVIMGLPLILGSWWAVVPFACYIPIIVIRTLDEERLLLAELDGYADYCARVRWRIVPFVW